MQRQRTRLSQHARSAHRSHVHHVKHGVFPLPGHYTRSICYVHIAAVLVIAARLFEFVVFGIGLYALVRRAL